MITIKDIARECGISFQTVSYVLSGKQGKVSPKNREIIINTAKRLGYSPNFIARSIVKNKTSLVGILLFAGRYYAEIAMKIQLELQKRGYAGVCAFWQNQEQAAAAFELMRNYRVEGIICAHWDKNILPCDIPLVNYGYKLPGFDGVRFPRQVVWNTAYHYFHKLGHTKIALLANVDATNLSLSPELSAIRPQWFKTSPSSDYSDGFQMMKEILQSPGEYPTAVIAHNDTTAIGAMQAISQAGLSVPEHISIIGRDNIAEAAFAPVPLSTFAVKGESLAQVLTRLLFERIENRGLPERDIELPWEFIERSSCASYRGN